MTSVELPVGLVRSAGLPGADDDRPEPTGLRERKKIATRRALGIAAMRLAADRGLENVLVEDIAEAAGVSARTFNNYFASKYEAICALGFDRAMRIGAALRDRPADEPLWDAIVAAVMSEYGAADQALDEDWMAGIRLVTSTPALRGEYLKVQAMTQYSLAEAIALRAGFKPAATMFPRILAASVTAAVQAAMERWLHADPPIALAPVVRRSLRQLADGMLDVLPPRLANQAANTS
ncbi:MAG: TetR family transcriptional regulator [Streptosporangiaceae bacterium]